MPKFTIKHLLIISSIVSILFICGGVAYLFIHEGNSHVTQHKILNNINENLQILREGEKDDTKSSAFLKISENLNVLKEDIKESEADFGRYVIILLVIIALISGWFYWLFRKMVLLPMEKLNSLAAKIETVEDINIIPSEYHELALTAKALQYFSKQLQDAKEFVINIGNGELKIQYNGYSDEKDLKGLPLELVHMRNKMQKAAEEEAQRKWTTTGLAHFAEILRFSSDKLEELNNRIIAELVKYLKANQGSLFMFEGNNKTGGYLKLVACYAFDRKKYINKTFELGEGLAGQAVLEGDTIYLTDIPQDYIQITSGLGHASPTALLVVPLKSNEKVFGVVELASFNKFEKYEIEFLEKVGESIAATISMAKINDNTKKLLEESQQITEEMRAQEEEMRQNMEELQATQEEIARKSIDMQGLTDAVDAAIIKGEYTPEGNIVKVNNNFCLAFGLSEEEALGKNLFDILSEEESEKFKKVWKQLLEGKPFKGEAKRVTKNGEEKFFMATYTPLKDSHGQVIRIYYLGQDITHVKQLEQESKRQNEELKAQEEELRQNMEEMQATQDEMERINKEMEAQNKIINSVAIVSKADLQGRITYVNEEFLKWSKYAEEELIGQNHRILKSGHQPDEIFKDLWKTISSGKIWRGEVKNKAKDGSYYWVDAIIAPILDEYGKPKEYIAQRFVINEMKEREAKLAEAMKKLEGKE